MDNQLTNNFLKAFPVLSIAGSDSSGGAGIQTDIRTITMLGGYPMTAITAVTAQNTTGVQNVAIMSPEMIESQIRATCSDISPMAVKTGMLCNSEIIHGVAQMIAEMEVPVVVDPVMVATSGSPLIDDPAVSAMAEELFPLAALITPNYHEAFRLTGTRDVERQVALLRQKGAKNILIKGGDAPTGEEKIDYLSLESEPIVTLAYPKVLTLNTHGTGCTLSSAIATMLALGADMKHAVAKGRRFVHEALLNGKDYVLGHGYGPCLISMNNTFNSSCFED